MNRNTIVYAAMMSFLLGAAASAQAPKPEDRPSVAAPKGCAPGDRLQAGADAPKIPETTGENLSDKLARNEGVLCPPNVDPEIKAPTPETGKMPVIPPPGSPGGDQTVKPK
jgi:hypothetical protein